MSKKLILITLVFIIFFQFRCYAAENPINVDITSLENFSKRLQQDINYMPNINPSKMIDTYKETGSLGLTARDYFNSVIKYLFQELQGSSRLLIQLLFLGILSAILQNIQSNFESKSVSFVAFIACYLVMAILIIKSFILAIQVGQQTIDRMVECINALMPALIGLTAAVGGLVSASTMKITILIVGKVTTDLIRDIIILVPMFTIVLHIVDNLGEKNMTAGLNKLLEKSAQVALGLFMLIFICVVTTRGVTAPIIDQVTLKTTKFAVDNFIPFVGKTLSDAVGTIAGYSNVLKSAIGVYGLILLAFICIFPMIKLLLLILTFKFVGAVMEPIVDGRMVKCLGHAGNSLVFVLACVLSVASIFFVIITMIISAGTNIL
jgi:stage III sporulation protein AE